jgi:heme iron utilization protein
MSMSTSPDTPRNPATDPIRPVDEPARILARQLLRRARFGALATVETTGDYPLATLVALANDSDGTPVTLVSSLSAHTTNMLENPHLSLLLAEPGKGDPLAHPRLSLFAKARQLDRNHPDTQRIRARYLARHPKATLYADFGDFAFFALDIDRASLNGGFGKAYRLERMDLLLEKSACAKLAVIEAEAVAHMNTDHAQAIKLYATALLGAQDAPWRIIAIDPAGCDLAYADQVLRLDFPEMVHDGGGLRKTLRDCAEAARHKRDG